MNMTLMEELRLRLATDTEFNQATVRVPLVTLISIFYFSMLATGILQISQTLLWVGALSIGAIFISIVLAVHIFFLPGLNVVRRLFAMIFDFGCITVNLSIDGSILLPVFGALLWVTVGYGIRYGGRYLLLSSGISLLCISIIIANNSYWQDNISLSATLVLTLIIGPGYAFALIARLQQAHEDSQAANQRKSRFVAQVSHDVRQPIHAISLLTARLDDTNLTAQQASLVTSIDQSVNSARQQLQTFLNVTTIEAGLMKPKREPVHLGNLLQELSRQHMEHAANVSSSIKAFGTSTVVLTDRIFLYTILQNLISNALKHASGSDILLGCRRVNGKIAVCIYDRGPGIPSEFVPNLTERYFRLPSRQTQKPEGTGLGLAIVKQLAEMLGLSVRIMSREQKGTAIWIAGFEMSEEPEILLPDFPQIRMRQLAGLNVALIEDDAVTLEATRDLLCRWGCNVTTYARPPSDIAHHNIIVSDFEFADGTSLADHYGRWDNRTPIVVVSGHPRASVEQAIGKQAIAVLEKPLRASELRSALMAAKLSL